MLLPRPLLLFCLSLAAQLGAADGTGRTAQQAVSDGNRLLAEGSYADAARSFGEAIELDPHSYLNYYKRATAYLSLGRQQAALDDFDAILRINPAFSQAHFQKAKILAKEGDFERAQDSLRSFGKSKADPDATELANSITVASSAATSARKAAKSKKWDACVDHATKALEVGVNSAELRELRLECEVEAGDVQAVYGDLSRLAALNPSALSLPLRLAHIAYFLLASPQATTHLKQCLHYDPDSKPCRTMHRLLRSLDKDEQKSRNFVEGSQFRQAMRIFEGDAGLLARFESALDEATQKGWAKDEGGEVYLPKQFRPRETSAKRLELYGLACKAAVGSGDFRKERGGRWCDVTLELDEGNVDGLVGRGERLLKEEKFEDAVRSFERAFENGGRSSQDILNRLQKAQRLLKQSKQKDYYKVLGVPRDADERTIKKAFRTAAKTAHPDVGGSEEKMAALNEAYEVLSNSELRARYDNGDDPNDPTGGQGGNPFAHHASGGGMPFQFFQQGGGGGFPGGGFPFSGGGGGGGGGRKMHFQWAG